MLTVQVSLSLLFYVLLTAVALALNVAVFFKAKLLTLDIVVTVLFSIVSSFHNVL